MSLEERLRNMPAENTGHPVALVTGVGPGTGAAIARRFSAGGYAVAMLARNGKRLAALEDEIENAKAFV
jgi:NADP-dependent 3-hydroxy acid dehydrogenase YdfG